MFLGTRISAQLRLTVLAIALAAVGCSVPNLEKPECTAARDVVKRFYSLHFSGDLHPSAESLNARKQFLTDELFRTLSGSTETSVDYFTQTDVYPRAFRVGACTADSTDKARLQVVLLWRDDARTEQKEVNVDTVRTGDKWLIDKISK